MNISLAKRYYLLIETKCQNKPSLHISFRKTFQKQTKIIKNKKENKSKHSKVLKPSEQNNKGNSANQN